jgi:hypothetical protein
MKIKRIIKYYLFNESVKEMELNKILDKVSNRKSLTTRERNFLELYKITREEDMKDFLYISKNSAFKKISELLEIGKKVICDLHDRNGKIGLEITGIENNFEEDTCTITMKGEEKHQLHDKFLYNLIYSIKKDEYSLQEQDEYFEKIESKNED